LDFPPRPDMEEYSYILLNHYWTTNPGNPSESINNEKLMVFGPLFTDFWVIPHNNKHFFLNLKRYDPKSRHEN